LGQEVGKANSLLAFQYSKSIHYAVKTQVGGSGDCLNFPQNFSSRRVEGESNLRKKSPTRI